MIHCYGGNLDLDAPLEIQRQEPPDLTFEGMPLEGMQGTSLTSSRPIWAAVRLRPSRRLSWCRSRTRPRSSWTCRRSRRPARDPCADLDGEPTWMSPDGFPLIRVGGLVRRRSPGRSGRPGPGRSRESGCPPRRWPTGCWPQARIGRVAEELELALAGYEDREDWARAAEMADRLVELSPDSVSLPSEAGGAGLPGGRSGSAAGGLSRSGRCAGQVGRAGQGHRGLRPGHRARSQPRARGCGAQAAGCRPSARSRHPEAPWPQPGRAGIPSLPSRLQRRPQTGASSVPPPEPRRPRPSRQRHLTPPPAPAQAGASGSAPRGPLRHASWRFRRSRLDGAG